MKHEELVKTILSAVSTSHNAETRTQAAVRTAIESDRDALVEVATTLETIKELSERNRKLSILRMQMRRASAELELKNPLTVRKVKGEWQCVEVISKPKAAAVAARIEAAVEIVQDHLKEKRVIGTLADSLIALGWKPPVARGPARALTRAHAATAGAAAMQ